MAAKRSLRRAGSPLACAAGASLLLHAAIALVLAPRNDLLRGVAGDVAGARPTGIELVVLDPVERAVAAQPHREDRASARSAFGRVHGHRAPIRVRPVAPPPSAFADREPPTEAAASHAARAAVERLRGFAEQTAAAARALLTTSLGEARARTSGAAAQGEARVRVSGAPAVIGGREAPSASLLPPGEAKYLRVEESFPDLPRSLRGRGAPLRALLEICVDRGGVVDGVRVRESAGADLDRVLVASVAAWRYRPRVVAGASVPFCHLMRFDYRR